MYNELYNDSLLETDQYTNQKSKQDLEKYFGTYDIDEVNEQFYNNIYNIGQR